MRSQGAPVLPSLGRQSDRFLVRERLLEAAEEVIGRRGFHGASIAEITGRAGIALGSFYLHFPSKEDVFRALIRERGASMREAIRRAIAGLRTRAEIEHAAFTAFFEWIAEHPWLYRVTRQAEFIDPQLREDWYREFAQTYAAGLRRAMNDGEIPETDPEVLAWAVMGMADFTAMRWLVWEEERAMPEDRLQAFLDIASRFLRSVGV